MANGELLTKGDLLTKLHADIAGLAILTNLPITKAKGGDDITKMLVYFVIYNGEMQVKWIFRTK